jgi:hypothetical protein
MVTPVDRRVGDEDGRGGSRGLTTLLLTAIAAGARSSFPVDADARLVIVIVIVITIAASRWKWRRPDPPSVRHISFG